MGGNWKCNGTKESVGKLVGSLNQMVINSERVCKRVIISRGGCCSYFAAHSTGPILIEE